RYSQQHAHCQRSVRRRWLAGDVPANGDVGGSEIRSGMNRYTTLLGQGLDLGTLLPEDRLLVERLVCLREKWPQNGREGALRFASRAREEIGKTWTDPLAFRHVVHGPVGVVYRDGVYRLCAAALKGEAR